MVFARCGLWFLETGLMRIFRLTKPSHSANLLLDFKSGAEYVHTFNACGMLKGKMVRTHRIPAVAVFGVEHRVDATGVTGKAR